MDLTLGKESIGKLFVKYSIPSVIAMIVFSLYIVIDGIFVGNVVGAAGLSAVNLAMPFFGVAMALGTMVAIGGGTITSIDLGRGDKEEARRSFSLAFYILTAITLALSVFTLAFTPTIARILGSSEELMPLVIEYLRSLCLFLATFVGSSYLSANLRVMGKPNHAMVADIIGAALNIVLDYIFIVKFGWGLAGAGVASGLAFTIGFIFSLVQYLRKDSILKFVKTSFDIKKVIKIFYNGSSVGVSAFSIILYISSLVTAVFSGICNGISPIISFNHGAKNKDRIQKLMKISVITISIIGVLSTILMAFGGETLIAMFTEGDDSLVSLTVEATRVYSIAFIVNGLNILSSAYFTAIEDAKTSAIISALRGAILIVIFIVLLPMIFGDVGIWLTVPFSEVFTVVVAFRYIRKSNRKLTLMYES